MADLTKFLSLGGLQRYDQKIKAFIADKVAGHLLFEIVETLDSVTKPKDNVIYLVPNAGNTNNVKDEYMWINGAWELIGTTAVDLSPYYTKTDADAKFETIVNADLVRGRVSTLESKVSSLEAINHDTYIAADEALEAKITTAYQAADSALETAYQAADEAVKTWANGEFSKLGHDHEISDVNGLQDALDAKADKSVVDALYTNDQIDGFLADKADKSVVDAMYTNAQIDGFLADKADADSVYTKDEVDGKIDGINQSARTLESRVTTAEGNITALQTGKADKSVVDAMYTNEQIDGFLADKVDTQVHENLAQVVGNLNLIVEDMYTNDQIDDFLADKADADSVYTKDEVDGKIDGVNQSASTLEDRVTTAEENIDALQTGKADKATTYTKDEVDASIKTLADELHAHMESIVTDAEIDALFTATV